MSNNLDEAKWLSSKYKMSISSKGNNQKQTIEYVEPQLEERVIRHLPETTWVSDWQDLFRSY